MKPPLRLRSRGASAHELPNRESTLRSRLGGGGKSPFSALGAVPVLAIAAYAAFAGLTALRSTPVEKAPEIAHQALQISPVSLPPVTTPAILEARASLRALRLSEEKANLDFEARQQRAPASIESAALAPAVATGHARVSPALAALNHTDQSVLLQQYQQEIADAQAARARGDKPQQNCGAGGVCPICGQCNCPFEGQRRAMGIFLKPGQAMVSWSAPSQSQVTAIQRRGGR
jgi:hypothetical protein